MAKSYLQEYKKHIETERRVSRTRLRPRNVYRISTYRDREGDVQRRSQGDDSSLIFVIGIHEGRVNCLKLNEIPSDKFLNFLKRITLPTVKLEDIQSLSDGLIDGDRSGKRLFERHIKPNTSIYNRQYSAYRSYNLKGLTYIQEVLWKPETLVKKLGIKSGIQEDIEELKEDIENE